MIFILLFLFFSPVSAEASAEKIPVQNNSYQLAFSYSPKNDSNEDPDFYSCEPYKHCSSLNFGSPERLDRYASQQLQLYFEQQGYSEKEILNQRYLYFSEDFVKLAKTYPGYSVTIKALHNQFKNISRTKKLVDILWSGKYRAGLKKRIDQLYHEIRRKNPLLIKPVLSEGQCTEYRKLQQVYDQICPRLFQAIKKRLEASNQIKNGNEHFSARFYHISSNILQLLRNNNYVSGDFTQCIGNQLQHVIHQESIDILQRLSILSPLSILYSYQSGLVDCVAAMRDYNEQGFIDNAVTVADFCWTLLDYGQAIAEGVAFGLYATAQDFVDHPVITTAIAIAGKPVLIYQLCKIVYNVAEIGMTTLVNPDKGKSKWNNYIQPLTQLISEIENKNITVRDCIKGGSAFATGWIAQGKLLNGLNKFCRTAHRSALTFIKNNPLGSSKQFAATPEGIIYDIPAKAPQSYEAMSNPEKGQSSISPVRVMNPSRLILETAYAKITPQLNKDIGLIKSEYAKNVRKIEGKDLKICFDHILGMDIGPKVKIQKLDVSGFHHDLGSIMEKSKAIKLIDKTKDSFGCYEANLYVGSKNFGTKTFFPADWSRQKVIDKILEAYDNHLKRGTFKEIPNGNYRIESFTNDRLKIVMYVTKNGELKTAYPIV